MLVSEEIFHSTLATLTGTTHWIIGFGVPLRLLDPYQMVLSDGGRGTLSSLIYLLQLKRTKSGHHFGATF
jgi:hypothetical protein